VRHKRKPSITGNIVGDKSLPPAFAAGGQKEKVHLLNEVEESDREVWVVRDGGGLAWETRAGKSVRTANPGERGHLPQLTRQA
jgi:hypothetical protein